MSGVNVDTSAIEGILKESAVLQKDINCKYYEANKKIEKIGTDLKIAKNRIQKIINNIDDKISKCKRKIEEERNRNESSDNNSSTSSIYSSTETLELLEEKKKKAIELSTELDNVSNAFDKDVEEFDAEFSKIASSNQLSNLNRFLDKLKMSIDNYLQVSFNADSRPTINYSNYTITSSDGSDDGESHQLTFEPEYHNPFG